MTELITLPSGLRIAIDPMPGLETVSFGLWVDAGGRHELAGENGLAHLLEHMAFKGTESRDALAIAEEIEDVGGFINAYTSREQTAYYARVMRTDTALAAEILADILQNSTFPDDELVREREVIRQEIAQALDTPDDLVFDLIQEVAYPDQSVGRSILGEASQVASFGRDEIRTFLDRNYAADNIVVAAAGAVEADQIVDLVTQTLGDLPQTSSAVTAPAQWQGGDRRVERELEQAHLVIGFDGVSYFDDDFVAAQVLAGIMGGGMSSRLFQEIRERRGLAYNVFAFSGSMVDGGMFGVYAGTAPEQLQTLAPVMADEMLRLIDDVTEREVLRARAQAKSGLAMSLESSSARIEQVARQIQIHGAPKPTDELIAEVDAVDVQTVKRVAERLLVNRAPAVAAVGPVAGLASYDQITALFARG